MAPSARTRPGNARRAPHGWSRSKVRRTAPLVAILASASLVAAACGSSSSGSTTGSGPTNSSGSSGSSGSTGGSASALTPAKLVTADATVAADEGKAAGEKLGSTTAPKGKTIAYLRFIASDSSDQLDYKAFTAAADALGWKVVPCDGQGNPTTMLSCGHTLLAGHPDALVDDGIPQSLIAPIIQQAKSSKIPVLSFSGTLNPCAPYDGCYTAPDGQMGKLLAEYAAKKLGTLPADQQEMIVQKYPADWGNARTDAIAGAISGTSVKVVASPTADPTNLVPGTQQQINALTSQYPNARAVWITFDGAAAGASQAVAAKFPGKQFPNAPTVLTFYQEPETLKLIKDGKIGATVYESLGWDAFVTVDQLAEHFARQTPFSTSAQPTYPGKDLEFWQPRIIDSSNVGDGSYPSSPVHYPAYFAAKWKAEFGVNDTALVNSLNPIP